MSSVVYVGVGQCGNQVLESFVNHEFNCNRISYDYLQCENQKLRCLFVDSELKVVDHIKSQSKFKTYIRESNIICGLNGRGSNWCYGYNGCKSAPDISSEVLNQIRKETERCDNFLGIVMCHSLGGGTGSGFGSKLTEMIREELQLHQILNCVVAPSDVGGDSPLQYYNCLLSLATLNRASDGILLFHNDSLLNQMGLDLVSPIKSATKNYKSFSSDSSINHFGNKCQYNPISMVAVNNLIASQMSSLLAPCSSLYPWNLNNSSINMELNEIIRSLCSFSDSKIVRCVSSSSKLASNADWVDVAKSTMGQLKCGFGNVYDTISTICSYRGNTKGDKHLPSLLKIQQQLNSKMHFVDWNKSDAIDVWLGSNSNQPNQITLAFNSGCIINYLQYVKSRSFDKFSSSAYLHWYYKFGGNRELFHQSFEEIDKIISNYVQITK